MSNPLVQLPHGDLWIAPQRDENNELVAPRADNIPPVLPKVQPNMTGDQMAILMADRDRLAAELAAARAGA